MAAVREYPGCRWVPLGRCASSTGDTASAPTQTGGKRGPRSTWAMSGGGDPPNGARCIPPQQDPTTPQGGRCPGHRELRQREEVGQVDHADNLCLHQAGRGAGEEWQRRVGEEERGGRDDEPSPGREQGLELVRPRYLVPVDRLRAGVGGSLLGHLWALLHLRRLWRPHGRRTHPHRATVLVSPGAPSLPCSASGDLTGARTPFPGPPRLRPL